MKYCGRYGYNNSREDRFEICEPSLSRMLEKAKKNEEDLEIYIRYCQNHGLDERLGEAIEIRIENLKKKAMKSEEDFWKIIKELEEAQDDYIVDVIFIEVGMNFV